MIQAAMIQSAMPHAARLRIQETQNYSNLLAQQQAEITRLATENASLRAEIAYLNEHAEGLKGQAQEERADFRDYYQNYIPQD